MDIIETGSLLVRLYAEYQNYHGEDADYAEAVTKAIAALTQCEEG